MAQLIRSSHRAGANCGCAGFGRNLTVAVAVIAGLFWAPRPAAAEDAGGSAPLYGGRRPIGEDRRHLLS
jgi:hypothetical protein